MKLDAFQIFHTLDSTRIILKLAQNKKRIIHKRGDFNTRNKKCKKGLVSLNYVNKYCRAICSYRFPQVQTLIII